MRMHESCDPALAFNAEELDRPVLCPGCSTEFLLRVGIAYYTIARMGGTYQVAYVPFHSHECYLKCVYIEGRA